MKTLKIVSILLTTLFIAGISISSLNAGGHRHKHYHKEKYRNSFFSLNFNVDSPPRYYVEREQVILQPSYPYPTYVEERVIYPQPYQPYYRNEVIVQRQVPVYVERPQVYYHPQYNYWRY